MQKRISGLAVCLSLAAPVVQAQLSGDIQQVDTVQQRRDMQDSAQALAGTNSVPELYSGESDDVGPQSVLRVKQRHPWVQAFADSQYFYTDNMFLASQGRQSADVLVSTVQAALTPPPQAVGGGELSPRVGYQQQWFNFDLAGSGSASVLNSSSFFPSPTSVPLNTFDFSVATIFGDVTWQRQNWIFTLGADYRRLLDSGDYYDFYHEYVPRWSVYRDIPLSRTTGLSLGYEGDYRVTGAVQTPGANYPGDYNDRTDQSLVLVGRWQLCPHLILQPFYRFEYSHYTHIDRDDFLNSVGLTLACPLTANITLRAFAGYDTLSTDGFYAQDYDNLDLGGGLNLSVRF